MEVVVYGRSEPPCKYCVDIVSLLNNKNIEYTYKDISEEKYFEEFLSYRLKTIPALFVDGDFKGGYTEAVNVFKEKV